MTETDSVNYLHRCDPRRSDLHFPRLPTYHWLAPGPLRVMVTLALIPLMTACYAHRAYDPRQQTIPYQGELRVLTLRGEVFMLRTAAVHGDTLKGDRIFCKSGLGYDKKWCDGVRPFPADSTRIAIPIGDIKEARTRSFSAVRTIPVVVAITAGVALGILILVGLAQVAEF